jgi:hypothetical protein
MSHGLLAALILAVACTWFGYQAGYIRGGTEVIRRQTEAYRQRAELPRCMP